MVIFGNLDIKDASTLPPIHNFKQTIEKKRKKTDFCKDAKTLRACYSRKEQGYLIRERFYYI